MVPKRRTATFRLFREVSLPRNGEVGLRFGVRSQRGLLVMIVHRRLGLALLLLPRMPSPFVRERRSTTVFLSSS